MTVDIRSAVNGSSPGHLYSQILCASTPKYYATDKHDTPPNQLSDTGQTSP